MAKGETAINAFDFRTFSFNRKKNSKQKLFSKQSYAIKKIPVANFISGFVIHTYMQLTKQLRIEDEKVLL